MQSRKYCTSSFCHYVWLC